MVFDQMRPDYIDRYNLKNFKSLRAKSSNYVNGYVGHMASVTVVSHAVMTTGLLPKDLPWHDDVMTDRKAHIGKAGLNYATTDLTTDEYLKMLSTISKEQFLSVQLKKLGGDVVSVGEKSYATIVMGGPYADRIVTLKKENGVCRPDGKNLPEYVSKNDRFTLQCKEKYGTEASLYALDGHHYYPGEDSAHLGGDIWTADAALQVMSKENWRGLFLTFGAIDKAGHMNGEEDVKMPRSYQGPFDLESACKIADAQLGRILEALKTNGLSDRTLVVITADHGGQSDTTYLGNGNTAAIGRFEHDRAEEPSFWLKRLQATGEIHIAVADTGLRVWLKDASESNEKKVVESAKEISGVTRIVARPKGAKTYSEVFKNFSKLPEQFVKWANLHDLELAETMNSETGPDVIVYFKDGVGFDRIGDHGGAQENVQRIPMLIYDPSQANGQQIQKPTRLADLKSIILSKIKK